MNYAKQIFAGLGLIALGGCGNVDSSHLIFGQQITVGLSISATAPDQGAELTLGFKAKDIAIVPVAVKKNGGYDLMGAETKTTNGPVTGEIHDAFSTFGQFSMDTGGNSTVSVGLGKFFATGNAAQVLAQGFQNKSCLSVTLRPRRYMFSICSV